MIKPSIGRVVLVHRYQKFSDQPEPAFVTYVHNDRLVNVAGFGADGDKFSFDHCPLLQDDDKPSEGTYAEWMEYQKVQAAKVPS